MKCLMLILALIPLTTSCTEEKAPDKVLPTQVHVRCKAEVPAVDCKKNAETVCPNAKEVFVTDEPATQTRLFVLECPK